VPFPYYGRLSARERRIYRASDAIERIDLTGAAELHGDVEALRAGLAAEDARVVARAAGALANGICDRLGAPRVRVRVLAARPSDDYGELHGLYEPEPPPARITLWMRTAAKRQVVAFKSFLRTLVHELLHHLDYEVFGFEETFHTEGFFKRESSVARQLLGEPPPPPAGSASRRG
jgi:hypothetical protein